MSQDNRTTPYTSEDLDLDEANKKCKGKGLKNEEEDEDEDSIDAEDDAEDDDDEKEDEDEEEIDEESYLGLSEEEIAIILGKADKGEDDEDEEEIDEAIMVGGRVKKSKAELLKLAKAARKKLRSDPALRKKIMKRRKKLAKLPMSGQRKNVAKKRAKTVKLFGRESIELGADVKRNIAELFADEDLSAGFKEKATTIFETAVKMVVDDKLSEYEDMIEAAQAAYDDHVEDEIEAIKDDISDELTESVDKYLSHIIEDWAVENKVAIESGIRTEIAESFISGLKNLFEEHKMCIPDSDIDVVEQYADEVRSLKEQLSREITKNVDLRETTIAQEKAIIFEAATRGMAATEKEKALNLAETIEDDSPRVFAKKLDMIMETWFPSESKPTRTPFESFSPAGESKAQYMPDGMKNLVESLSRLSAKND